MRDGAILTLRSSNGIHVPRVTVARSFWSRFRGRLGTREFPEGEGLLLVPCHEIHMLGMRYALDVVFLDAELRILATRTALPPGTLQLSCKGAWATLELPAGTLDHRWTEGVKLATQVAGV